MQHRTQVAYRFEPEGPDTPGPVMSFQLARVTSALSRRSIREDWLSSSPPVREILASGLTRSQLFAIITDAADWLRYINEEGS